MNVEKTIRKKFSTCTRLEIACGQQWRCNICGQLLPASFDIDHIVSLCCGGDNRLTNLQALCNNCHGEKTRHDNRERYERAVELATGKSRFFDPSTFAFRRMNGSVGPGSAKPIIRSDTQRQDAAHR